MIKRYNNFARLLYNRARAERKDRDVIVISVFAPSSNRPLFEAHRLTKGEYWTRNIETGSMRIYKAFSEARILKRITSLLKSYEPTCFDYMIEWEYGQSRTD